MEQTTITIQFKTTPTPTSEEHLKHLALEWARSKGAEIVDGKIII